MSLSIILNVYKRQNLLQQLELLENQTIQDFNIIINRNWEQKLPDSVKKKYKVYYNTNKLWVRQRFLTALNCWTEYILVIDDDMLPQKNFIKNCWDTNKKVDWVIGSVWHIYHTKTNRRPHTQVWWTYPNKEITQVDIVWHTWFFKRERLEKFRDMNPPAEQRPYNWEDIWFWYVMQRLDKGCYVMSHRDTSYRGTDWNQGIKLATDEHCNARDKQDLYNRFYLMMINRGFKILRS